jgi:putative hemolysin
MKTGVIISVLGGLLVVGLLVVQAGAGRKEQQVTNYEECVGAGFKVLSTTPKKCITDDDRIFAEEQSSGQQQAELTVTNFEECLEAGYEIKDSFPRECLTPDGDSFIESVVMGAEDSKREQLGETEQFCKQEGGTVHITYSDSGNMYFCEFSNGRKCEIEAFYLGDCTK